jgi:hypothetical protein
MTIAFLDITDSFSDFYAINATQLDSTCVVAPTCSSPCAVYSFISHQCVENPAPVLPCSVCTNPRAQGVCVGTSCVCVAPPPPPSLNKCHPQCQFEQIPPDGNATCIPVPDGIVCSPPSNSGVSSCYTCSSGSCLLNDTCPYGTPALPPSRRRTPSPQNDDSGFGGFISFSAILGIALGVTAVIFCVIYSIIRLRQMRAARLAAVIQNGMQANMNAVAAHKADKIDPSLLPQVFHQSRSAIVPGAMSTAFSPQCVICFDSNSNAAVSPCGHILCWTCLSQLDSCPMCRCPIVAKILMQPSKMPEGWSADAVPSKQRKPGMGLCGCCGEQKLLIQTSLPCCHLFCDKPGCSANANCPQCNGDIQSYLPLRWISAEDSEVSRLDQSRAVGPVENPQDVAGSSTDGSDSDDGFPMYQMRRPPPTTSTTGATAAAAASSLREAWDHSDGSDDRSVEFGD